MELSEVLAGDVQEPAVRRDGATHDTPAIVQAIRGAQDAGMGEIINLRSAKKRLARKATGAKAKQNRVRHGRTEVEKANDRREEARRAALLDGSARDKTVC